MKCVVVGNRTDSRPRRLANELEKLYVPVDVTKYGAKEVKPTIDLSGLDEQDFYGLTGLMYLRDDRLRPDSNMYEKLMALTGRALRDCPTLYELSDIAALIPYFYYARQDTAFKKGEPESLSQTAEAIESYADIVFTYNSHIFGREGRHIAQYFGGASVEDISMAKPLADALKKEYGIKRPLIINPDDEEKQRLIHMLNEFEGSEFGYVMQDRDKNTGKKVVVGSKMDAHGKTVVIFDDLSDTGGTLARAVDEVRKQDPGEIFITVPNMFTKKPIEKLGGLVRDGTVRAVLTTDSFSDSERKGNFCEKNGITVVDTVEFVADYIRNYDSLDADRGEQRSHTISNNVKVRPEMPGLYFSSRLPSKNFVRRGHDARALAQLALQLRPEHPSQFRREIERDHVRIVQFGFEEILPQQFYIVNAAQRDAQLRQ